MKRFFTILLVLVLSQMIFAQNYSVTFQVDMNVHQGYGFFDPSLSDVLLRGSFNDWGDQEPMNDDDNDGIYTLTKELPAGSIAFKFFYKNIYGQDSWEEIDDRTFDVAGDTVMPVVYFMNDEGSKKVIDVFFQVNMEIEKVAGRFNPANDVVTVRGTFNAWEGTDTCFAELGNTNLYSASVKYLAEVGDTIHYKFNINGDTWENDFPLNNGGHRLIGISQEDLDNLYAYDPYDYPNEYFNGLEFTTLTLQESEIIFTVDMNDATDLNGTPFSAIENVFLCGEMNPLYWAWDSENVNRAIFMVDDGTSGDVTAGDGIWSTTVTFPQYTSTNAFSYKYGANYDLPSNNGLNDNENYSGEDHWIQLPQTIISGTVNNVFGEATTSDSPHTIENLVTTGVEEDESDLLPEEFTLQQNYPNPFNPSTNIKFSIPESGDVSLKVYDILGKEIVSLVNETLDAGAYTFKFDSQNYGSLASGIYLVRLESKNNSASIKMMLLK